MQNPQDQQHSQSNQPEGSPGAEGTNPSEAAADVKPDLEHLLKEAEIKASEHHDAWMRARAETENIRKRAQTDVTNAHKYAIENFSADLVPVMDSLEAALAVENASLESFKNGMELTQRQLIAIFDKFNITIIDPKGEKFDPHQHQAMCMVDSELAPNMVVQVMQKGYKLHDRIIRPALVAVSKARGA